ncbi:MAG: HAD family phosphatase [Spirochaetes bacterium]|uniref:HAD family phosphatase n=1 Tax=Candidatus Ornithospirochaeta stercoripullorum TaxID=2840899 RepID=A0A9D9E2S9_9SPIO|nr:HAD family phosphatase [Candidatus Ornithospirochaeta stercoripullorum]
MSFQLPNADGYIFDFNGTLYWDSQENKEAWSATFESVRGTPLADDEFALLNGRTDDETVIYLKPDAPCEERAKIADSKELLYKKLCIEHGLELSPGAEEFLSKLKERGAKMAIASSAPKCNMNWYIEEYGLDRFFKLSEIIAGRTDIPSKPNPAIFSLAMSCLGTTPERTIIFEDSASGVKAALDSGVFLVVRIKDPGLDSIRDERVIEVESFSELVL